MRKIAKLTVLENSQNSMNYSMVSENSAINHAHQKRFRKTRNKDKYCTYETLSRKNFSFNQKSHKNACIHKIGKNSYVMSAIVEIKKFALAWKQIFR